MRRRILIGLGLATAVAVLVVDAHWGEAMRPPPGKEPGAKADRVVVLKGERRMTLMRGAATLWTFDIGLGFNPVGHKQREGDGRTPEGEYVLDWRNPKSGYYRSFHISYPNATDRATAQKRGEPPGGDIMIHGQPNGLGWLDANLNGDWTAGCIAVTNLQMDIIWSMVDDGTPIEIRP